MQTGTIAHSRSNSNVLLIPSLPVPAYDNVDDKSINLKFLEDLSTLSAIPLWVKKHSAVSYFFCFSSSFSFGSGTYIHFMLIS